MPDESGGADRARTTTTAAAGLTCGCSDVARCGTKWGSAGGYGGEAVVDLPVGLPNSIHHHKYEVYASLSGHSLF